MLNSLIHMYMHMCVIILICNMLSCMLHICGTYVDGSCFIFIATYIPVVYIKLLYILYSIVTCIRTFAYYV